MTFLFDSPVVHGRKQHFNPKPVVPKTDWVRPKNFPNLAGAGAVSFDVETHDPNLKELGPGWGRGDGYIVGLAVATDDGFKAYYPVRHTEDPHLNFPPDEVFDWARQNLTRSTQWKVAHNAPYDYGWLREEGVIVDGPLWDTYVGEKLIHFRSPATLEATGQRRVGRGKKATLLLKWLFQYMGRGKLPDDEDLDDEIKKWIHLAPPSLVGPYGEEDVILPLEIAAVQEKLLSDMGLDTVFEMENALTPLWVQIRHEGVRVDEKAAEIADHETGLEIDLLQKEIDHLAGRPVEVSKNHALGEILVGRGFKISKTPKTKLYSVTKEVLEKIDDPFADKVLELKELEKFRTSFIRGAIIESSVKGRVHGTLKSFGTITGRLSAEMPNLQQIPSRNERLMQRVRSIFIPEAGHWCWHKSDYAQLQYRILAHFAAGRGAEELRQIYNSHPETSYHKLTHQMIKDLTGVDLPYKQVKNCNFAVIFGAGNNKISRMIGLSKEESEPFFTSYHNSLPFVKDTMDAISRETAARGYSQTILGRRVDFDRWECKWRNYGDERVALPLEKAVQVWGSNIQRADLYKSTNYVIQGSEGDLLKMALWKAMKAGIFNVIGVPKLLVHDELDVSVRDDSKATREAFRELKHIMQTAIPFKIPILVEEERGENWGYTEDFNSN